jgi:hypothetical protein
VYYIVIITRASHPGQGQRWVGMSLRKSPKLTAALLAANRQNAQKSTGPRTARGKTRARLNGLRHGRRSPLFVSFRSALWENPPNKSRSVSERLLRLEEARHPLFAYYIRESGRVRTRNLGYALTAKRKLKQVRELIDALEGQKKAGQHNPVKLMWP